METGLEAYGRDAGSVIDLAAVSEAIGARRRAPAPVIGTLRPAPWHLRLSGQEEALYRVLLTRRGQCLSATRIAQLLADATADVALLRRPSERQVVALLGSLGEKLRYSSGAWRIRKMEGCGFILWH